MKGQSLVGEIIANRYELLSIVGSGGMGVVYKARQIDLDRVVAIKFLDLKFVSDEEMYSRFQLEARALSQLWHKNIGGFYAFGALENGAPFIVMELLEGQSLSSILSEGQLSVERLFRIAIQITDGMSYAHQSKLIHRDLKPGNIIVVSDSEPDTVKIVDFGLAKHIDVGTNPAYTRTGQLLGTPQYLSPEQCRGLKLLDARVDIYAFGCVLYEMLTGAPPFEADSPVAYVYKHLNERLSFPNESSKDESVMALRRIIMHCMEKDPEDRYQSMLEVQQDILCVKAKRFKDVQAPNIVQEEVARVGMRQIAILSSIIVAGSIIVWLLVNGIRQSSGGDDGSIDGLLQQVKDAENQRDLTRETTLLRKLREQVLYQHSQDRANALLVTAQELKAYPLAANSLALDSISEAFGSYKRKRTKVKDSTYTALSHVKDAVFSANLDVDQLTWKMDADPDAGFKAARTVDQASKILLANRYVADRNLTVALMAANNIQGFQRAYGLCAFHNFLLKSVEKSRIPPSRVLLEFYQALVFLLRSAGNEEESTRMRKTCIALTLKLYGPKSPELAAEYLSGIVYQNVSREDLEAMNVASGLVKANASRGSEAWLLVCRNLAQISIDSKHLDRAISYANQGLSLDPSASDASAFLLVRGRAFQGQKQYRKSLADLRAAYKLLQDDPQNRWQVGPSIFGVLIRSGEKTEAREFLKNELADLGRANIILEQSHLLLQCGEIFLQEKDYPEAEKSFEKSLQLSRSVNNLANQRASAFWLLITHNITDASDSRGLQQALEIALVLPESLTGLLTDSNQMIPNALRRYKKHNNRKELKESAAIIVRLLAKLSKTDSKDVLTAAVSLLDTVEDCAGKSSVLTVERERLKTLLAEHS